MFAAGDGGVVAFDGKRWSLIAGVPDTTYRTAWGRSPSEVWIGGDDVLLARTADGWQQQQLVHDGFTIDDYSVLAIAGDRLYEYAIVRTGGKLLFLTNEGAAWDSPLWSIGEPSWPLPQDPGLALIPWSRLLAAGDGDLVVLRTNGALGVPAWEVYPLQSGEPVPRLTSISAGYSEWAAVGGRSVLIADDQDDVWADHDTGRNARGVAAGMPGQFFVVGDSVEACERGGCVPELAPPGARLQAVWSDRDGTACAVGDDVIACRHKP